MKFDVSKLFRKKVQTLPFEVTSQLSTIDRDELKISLDSPIIIKGNAYYDGEVVTLVGSITTTIRTNCSRCLEESVYSMTVEFEDEFSKLDLNNEDGYLISEEETIDLTEMVTDNLILSLPVKVVCDDNCKGLCPKCGKNLNKGLCNCTSDDVDPRLEVLRDLFKGD